MKDLNDRQLLEKIAEDLDSLQRLVLKIALDQPRPRAPKLTHAQVAEQLQQDKEMDKLVADLQKQILARVQAFWKQNKRPIEARDLARTYGRKAQPVGGVDTILGLLAEKGETIEVSKLTNGRIIFLRETFEQLQPTEVEAFREFGLTEREVGKLRAKERESQLRQERAHLSPEELADIERQTAEAGEFFAAQGLPIDDEAPKGESA